MPGRTTLARLVTLLGYSLIPLFAQSGETQSCVLQDAAVAANSTVYALCERGTVLATADRGKTWTALETGAAAPLRAIAFIDAQRGFVAGDGGQLFATTDGGKTWQPRETGVTERLTSLHFTGESGWAAGYGGVILHSPDGGHTWMRQASGTTMSLDSIFFSDPEHGWAVGWVGTILRTTDGGRTWEQVRAPAASWSLSSVCFRDAQNGWIVGFAGQVLRSRDGGATWEALKSPVQGWLTSLLLDTSNNVWASYDEGVLVSADDGANWRPVTVDERVFLKRLIRVEDSIWGVGPFGMVKDANSQVAYQRIDDFYPGRPASGAAAGASRSAP